MSLSDSSRLLLQASLGAVFQLASADRFLALPSPASRPIFGITPAHLTVLASFVEAGTADEIEALFTDDPDMEPVSDLIEDLLGWNLLVVVDAERGHAAGFGHIESHLPMLADRARVETYAAAIRAGAPGRRVAELGCGAGILSLLAAKAGATSVYAVEETDIAEIASVVFRSNDVHDRIILDRANSFDVEPPAPVDLLIHELFGVDPFEEGVLASITDARRRWLAPGGRLLPSGFTVRACLVGGPGWMVGADQLAAISAMADTLGIDLEPVLRAGRKGPTRRVDADLTRPPREALRTTPADLIHVDLTTDLDVAKRSVHSLHAHTPGAAGAVLVWFDVHLDETHTLSTSPLAPTTHWGWQIWDLPLPLHIEADSTVTIELSLETEDGSAQLEVLDVCVH